MAAPKTIEQIEATAQRARNAIATLQKQLQEEQRDINRTAFFAGRPLTAEEQARIAEIGIAFKKSNDALVELAFVTLQNLDDSQEVQLLQTRMTGINAGLSVDLDKLKDIQAVSATAARVADTVAKVAAEVAKLAAAAAL
jgi:hypothetical protein